MRTIRRWKVPTAFLLVLFVGACHDAGPAAPGTEVPVLTETAQRNVETLIAGSLAGWWRANHGFGPGPALSTAADALTSSWQNWGMLYASQEPRQDLSSMDPPFREFVSERPWLELYRTLSSARDGMLVLMDGHELGADGTDTARAIAFARFMQGLALGSLAQLFDQAWILDEDADPESVALSPYSEVMAAALDRLGEAIAVAESESFILPADWVGFNTPLDQGELARLARSWRARLRISGARTPQERAAVDWSAVLDDASNGITEDWSGRFDGAHQSNWAWSVNKIFGSHPVWGRLDYRTIGPADAGGGWTQWMAQPAHARGPFLIDTDDSRITGGSATADGKYVSYHEQIFFQPQRGQYHFSFYVDRRWAHLWQGQGLGLHTDFPVKELEFIEAEALFRLGDRAGATAIVNRWRANGDLPPFADPNGVAPGGSRCVPRRADGTCGDLWDALRYEKRIEVFHYGPFTAYLDSRAWGDLVSGTFTHLPRPEVTLPELLQEVYATASPNAATALANARSAEDLALKVDLIRQFDLRRNANPGDAGAG